LIAEIGFEELNFKKLAIAMDSTEASVYRYFENKYKLLTYLVSWYWDFMHLDTLNKEGYYVNYKKIVKTLSEIILEIDPDFKFPKAFATNLIEQSLNNEYYIDHLPSLTDVSGVDVDARVETIKMIEYLIARVLR